LKQLAEMNFRFVMVVALVFVSLSCSKNGDSNSRPLFDASKVEKEFLATGEEFLTPPLAIVDDGFFLFSGFNATTPEARLAEWKSLRKVTFEDILEEAARKSSQTFDRDFLELSARLAGIIETNGIQEIATTNNILSLQRLIATHEMRKRMAVETALMLSYRAIKEK
jgi:hypothetical protein